MSFVHSRFTLPYHGSSPFYYSITTSIFMYAYFSGRNNKRLQAESTYWQRFHAKKDH